LLGVAAIHAEATTTPRCYGLTLMELGPQRA